MSRTGATPTVLLGAALLVIGLGAAPARGATSEVTSITVDGTDALDGGYGRVFGTVSGVVSPREAIDGLPAEGLAYTSEYELIRPADRSRPRLMLVEAENRGSPLLLNALSGKSSASGPPASAAYPKSVSRVLESAGPRVRPRPVADRDLGGRPGDRAGRRRGHRA